MKFNFKQISAVIASVVMLGSSVGIAAAATTYPAPFVAGGAADVAIIYGTGSGVSAMDVVEAGNIQADLQSKMSTSTGTTSSVSGEGTKIEQSSNRLNINEGTKDVWSTQLTASNMPNVLKTGIFSNRQNSEYKYEQKIDLGNMNFSHFADSDYNGNSQVPDLGFKLTSNTVIANYTLDFVTDPEATVGTDLTDFENRNIEILGKDYFILDFKNGTAGTTKITLLDSAKVASLSEGETKDVVVGDKTYKVSIGFISSDEVILDVDGIDTEKLSATGTTYGNTGKLADGTFIGIKSINVQNYAGGSKTVEFSIGKGKLEITDSSNIKINDKSISDLYGYITLSTSGSKRTWQKLVIEWRIEDEAFLTPTKELLMPGFEAIKLSMGETTIPDKELTSLQVSNEYIELKTTIKDGEVTLPLLYISTTTGNITGIGKSATEKLFTSNSTKVAYNVTDGDYEGFIVSYATSRDAETHYLKATVRTEDAGTRNYTTITSKVGDEDIGCTDKQKDDVCTIGPISLTINAVNWSSSAKYVVMSVNTGGSFNKLYTKDGLTIYLPWSASGVSGSGVGLGVLNTSVETEADVYNDGKHGYKWTLWMSEEDKDGTLTQNLFAVNISSSGTSSKKVTISEVGPNLGTARETTKSSEVWESYVSSNLATKVIYDKSGDEYDAQIEYHGGEVYANLYVAEPSAVVSGSGTSSTLTQLGTVVFKDSEVSSVSSKNLIVVGGSCINSVAAKVLGSGCGASFTEATKVGSGQFLIKSVADTYATGKVVLVVAGYEAADTQNAAKYLRTKAVDTTAGKSYIGTSATEATLQVA